MNAYYDIVNTMFYIVYPMLMTACLVLGIIIICQKDRATKMLGIWVVVSAASGLIYLLFIFCAGFISKTDSAFFATARTVMTGILGYASIAAFFMYAKLRYKVKAYILIIILVCMVSSTFIINLSWQFAFKTLYTEKNSLVLQFVRSIISIVPSVVENIIFLLVYLKNRPVEKELKLLYWWPVSVLICSALIVLVYTIGCFIPSYGSRRMRVIDGVNSAVLILKLTDLIIFLLFAIYILVKGRRKQREKLEIV